jgi:hypothetical protein
MEWLFTMPPEGGVVLTVLTGLTRLTVLTADRIDQVDLVDGRVKQCRLRRIGKSIQTIQKGRFIHAPDTEPSSRSVCILIFN